MYGYFVTSLTAYYSCADINYYCTRGNVFCGFSGYKQQNYWITFQKRKFLGNFEIAPFTISCLMCTLSYLLMRAVV